MKNKIASSLLIVGLFALSVLPMRAQTNTAPTPQSLFSTVTGYFTSFNTNEDWLSTPFDGWTALNYQATVNTSAEIGMSYDIWHFGTNSAIAPEAVERNAGVAGTVLSYQGGLGFSLFKYDLKVTPYVDFGYNTPFDSSFFELGGRLKKKFNHFSYGGIGISFNHFLNKAVKQQNTPTASIEAGVAF